MHISEGILTAPVLSAGAAFTLTGLIIGLKKLDYDRIPEVAVLSSVFFVASLIHIPIGPSSVHLILNGIQGLLLGWTAFPAIFIALILQALLFQFGGITSLGVNNIIMAIPAVCCYYLFAILNQYNYRIFKIISSFTCGFISVFLSSILAALALYFTGDAFIIVAKTIVIAHLPVMIIEGLVTTFCIEFLKKVRPELLEIAYAKK